MQSKTLTFKNNRLPNLLKCMGMGLLLIGAPLTAIAASVGCNDTFVQLDPQNLVINIAPNLGDDTVNIQCALDAAVMGGVPIVRLEAATYSITRISVEGFNGSFQGRTREGTRLRVFDDSINCPAMADAGLQSAVIKFVKGEPRLRFMTILADRPCKNGNILDAIVHFTGESTMVGNCDNDVIFGVVDRVRIDGIGALDEIQAAISVSPEGSRLGGCKDTLLGTFKLNRSTIMATITGVLTSMKAGAQVDINFNEFHYTNTSVDLVDTNQNTTITGNKFFGNTTVWHHYYGVLIRNSSDTPPPLTRVIVHSNDFSINSSHPPRWSYGVKARWIESKVSSVISNNRFVLSGDRTYGVNFRNNSNVHVNGNRFDGSGARAIYVNGNGSVPVTGWTITANTGLAGFTSTDVQDIRLDESTSNCIVGPGQGASVMDNGVDNTVLPQWQGS